jgi:hypothetical protein
MKHLILLWLELTVNSAIYILGRHGTKWKKALNRGIVIFDDLDLFGLDICTCSVSVPQCAVPWWWDCEGGTKALKRAERGQKVVKFAKICKVSYPISVRDNAIKWVWSCVFAAPNINQACTEGPTMVAPLSTYERKQALQMFHIHTMYIYIYTY